MALETVKVYAVDENSDPLVGVLVQAYDDGGVFVTQNTTAIVGAEAYCELPLEGDDPPNAYTIRLSKTGVAFDGLLGTDSETPQSVDIYSPPSAAPVTGTNNFQVQGQTFTRPAATDPRLCRASGFFKDLAGRPLVNMSIRFMNLNIPTIVDSDAVLGGSVSGQTDANGYFEVDLYRGGEYRANIESLDIHLRVVCLPDASSVNIVDLMFPTVATISYNPDPVSIAVGAYVDVELTITDTVGLTHAFEDGDIIVTVDDETVASIGLQDGFLHVIGVAVGSTVISVERADTSIVVVDEPVFSTLSVTVT